MTAFLLVEVTGLEPTASWSRTKRATKLRYTSLSNVLHYTTFLFVFQVKSIGNREIFKFFLRKENGEPRKPPRRADTEKMRGKRRALPERSPRALNSVKP